ncbi:MAG: molybdopterin molybdenumtransferase MoeA [Actinobacteria bacterium]|nr:MAG: molybdopterin molybdenumtransferase MoeA [Actinomycetota bacterium]
MIGVEEALRTILDNIVVLPPQEVELLEAAGLVLAEDVVSPVDLPPFHNSAMDGFAVRAADLSGASEASPVSLRVLEDLPAGYVAKSKVEPGTAIRIMTGAPIPEGADSVVMVERTEQEGELVRVNAPVNDGENVRYRGEELGEGEPALARGVTLGPAQIGLLAAIGRGTVKAIRRPVVGILSTGDEVVEVGEPLAPGKIRNSNSYSLAAQVIEAGAVPKRLGIARDTQEDVTRKLGDGLECDALITTGGVSVGDYDMVKAVLSSLGRMVFWKVAMRPGKPLAFGVIQGTPVFGLPGNPTSSMVSFEQFVKPAIRKMSGHVSLGRVQIEAVLEEDIRVKPKLRYFLRAVVQRRDGTYFARLAGPQGSGMLKPIAGADGLLVVPEELTEVKAGERLNVQLLHPLEE